MSGQPRYYLTTPIYYVNDRPHIGHAYTTLACDVLARFKRLDGFTVHFLTGTDEHGQKVQKSAAAAGVDTATFTDRVSRNFRDLAVAMNYSIDDFIRTTEPRHHRACQDLWRRMMARGHLYKGAYAGWYSVRDEAFYDEAELTVDADGNRTAPSGAEVSWVEEPSYFFRLSAFQEPLLEHYRRHPDFVLPEGRLNEVASFVAGGLNDLSVSRTTFDWGIPVPDDDAHVMYVWLDALTNYMTAVGFPEDGGETFRSFWPADLHMVGKDILRFHAVYWPAFLMAAELPLPKRVFAHGWLMNRGQKMSKSLGNVVSPYDLKDRYGLDQSRYFLMREVPFGSDGYISHDGMVQRINSDLANDFGNLAQRVLSMVNRNCGAQVPQPDTLQPGDEALLAAAGETLLARLRTEMDRQSFHRALEAVWAVIGEANRYVDEQAPWALRKTDPDRMATVLYALTETLRRLAILVQPVMPEAMGRLLDLLAVPAEARSFAHLGDDHRLVPGAGLPAPMAIFPRYVESDAQAADGSG